MKSVACAALVAVLAVKVAGERENFRYNSFLNRPGLKLNGDASDEVGELVLTRPAENQVGAVWFERDVDVENGFFTSFTFRVTNVENEGGEGFAFVLQSQNPYSIGNGGSGLGFDGLGKGLAVEFDAVTSPDRQDPEGPHVSVHCGLFSPPLSSVESRADWSASLPDLTSFDENLDNEEARRYRVATIEYTPTNGVVAVRLSETGAGKGASAGFVSKQVLRAQVGAIQGRFHVGFTAATGKSFARYALREWMFQSAGSTDAMSHSGFCSPGFEPPQCVVSNAVAQQECPRRPSCNTCLEDVYNCAWCASQSKCVVGITEELAKCADLALEPRSCSGTMSRIWLYLLGLAFTCVLVFGWVLFRVLPARQSFRAISILVALVGGGISGMVFSFVISASLVEISETYVFSIMYGLFFLLQFWLLGAHLVKVEVPNRGYYDAHVILLSVCCFFVLIASIACFLLDRRLVHWMPEVPKVLLYTVLGAALNFCLVFSCAELIGECLERYCKSGSGYDKNIATSLEREQNSRSRPSIVQSQARIALLAAASLLSGTFFGFMFGTLRIEEESQYRVALALQQESAYTYPVGCIVGAVSAMLYQLLQLPLTSDDQIDRILMHGGDL